MTTPIILTRPYVGAESAEKERNLIVSFLRRQADMSRRNGHLDRAASLDWETDRIENGDHLRSQPKVPGPYSGT